MQLWVQSPKGETFLPRLTSDLLEDSANELGEVLTAFKLLSVGQNVWPHNL